MITAVIIPFFIAPHWFLLYFAGNFYKNVLAKTMTNLPYPQPLTGEIQASNGNRCCWAMFGTTGGVSSGHYSSLNIGFNVGDKVENVAENRKRVKEQFCCQYILSASQVHGDAVYCLQNPLEADKEIVNVDGLITSEVGVALMIQHADCQAILLYDSHENVIAALHSGWRGSVQNIAAKTVAKMISGYGSNPQNIHACISPSLGPCCAEFVNYKKELPRSFYPFMIRDNYFDFLKISKHQLQECGVQRKNIEMAGICTCCTGDYFSYRRAQRTSEGRTGRNCSVIVIRKEP